MGTDKSLAYHCHSLASYQLFTHDQLPFVNMGRTLHDEPKKFRDLEKQSL